MTAITIPKAKGKLALGTLISSMNLGGSVQPHSPGKQPYKISQPNFYLSSTSIHQNALDQFGPNRFLTSVHLDYPQNHYLHPVLMIPFYKFKKYFLSVLRQWEG